MTLLSDSANRLTGGVVWPSLVISVTSAKIHVQRWTLDGPLPRPVRVFDWHCEPLVFCPLQLAAHKHSCTRICTNEFCQQCQIAMYTYVPKITSRESSKTSVGRRLFGLMSTVCARAPNGYRPVQIVSLCPISFHERLRIRPMSSLS